MYYNHAVPQGENTTAPNIPNVETVKEACEQISAEIDSDTDHRHAFTRATELADYLREAADRAARLRAITVYKLQCERRLSLAELAHVLGVSKSRASQFVTAGKRAVRTQDPQGLPREP